MQYHNIEMMQTGMNRAERTDLKSDRRNGMEGRRYSVDNHQDSKDSSEPSTSSRQSYFQKTKNKKSGFNKSQVMSRIRIGFQKIQDEQRQRVVFSTPYQDKKMVSSLFSSILQKIKDSQIDIKESENQEDMRTNDYESIQTIQVLSTQSEDSQSQQEEDCIKSNTLFEPQCRLNIPDEFYDKLHQQYNINKKQEVKAEKVNIKKSRKLASKNKKLDKIKNIDKKKTKASKKQKNKVNYSKEVSIQEPQQQYQDPEVQRLRRAIFRFQNASISDQITNLRLTVRQKKLYEADIHAVVPERSDCITKGSINRIRSAKINELQKRLLIEVQ